VYGNLKAELEERLGRMAAEGLLKEERVIACAQGPEIVLADGRKALNFCANNYLGLSGDERLRAAAAAAMEEWGYGLSSVRFICGTQSIHKRLEDALADYLGMEGAILFSSCFDANGGVFEPLLDEDCAIIADGLNHASIIDGVRLCKARRWIYRHADMSDAEEADPETGAVQKGLERCLKEAAGAKRRLIATDGVFSMDGDAADLNAICDLAERYDALVMVDDSHATGFVGPRGRGTWEDQLVAGRIDILSTTFGKALGGASGGCVAGRREIVEYLRQKSRPYLFSNSLAPAIAGGTLKALEIARESSELRRRLYANAGRFREGMAAAGFELRPGSHPICPVLLYDEKLASSMAAELLNEGIYAVGFSFPVVPRGMARIRVQLSAAHAAAQVDRAVESFAAVRRRLGAIG